MGQVREVEVEWVECSWPEEVIEIEVGVITKDQERQIVASYEAGEGMVPIARRHGVSYSGVRQALVARGITLRGRRWQGDAVGYDAFHGRLRRMRGRASSHMCSCGEPAREWSYNHSGVKERFSGGRCYSTDVRQYDALCRRCHDVRDGRTIRGSLTARDASEIRWLWSTGEWDNHHQLAEEFGVSVSTIGSVLVS